MNCRQHVSGQHLQPVGVAFVAEKKAAAEKFDFVSRGVAATQQAGRVLSRQPSCPEFETVGQQFSKLPRDLGRAEVFRDDIGAYGNRYRIGVALLHVGRIRHPNRSCPARCIGVTDAPRRSGLT